MLFVMYVVLHIVIGLSVLTCGQCVCFAKSNIVIGLYVLDMWSVICVSYVGGGI